MPELPEIETIKLGLQKKIIGLKIKKVELIQPKSFIGDPKRIQGKTVLKVWRRAKILGIDLAGPAGSQPHRASSHSLRLRAGAPRSPSPATLLLHLKMTGQLVWVGSRVQGIGSRFIGGHPTEDMVGPLPNKHTRVIFTFSNGSHLYFNDQRRFGWIKIVDRQQAFGSEAQARRVTGDSSLGNLGPEPLKKSFTWKILKSNLLNHKSQPVKVAIMDQTVVSGIGNIYASEACFNASLDPRKKVGDLGDLEFKRLHKGIVKALQDGIKHGGSTRAHFVDSSGRKGYFLDYAYVYGKDKHPCKICGTIIEKIQLGGRGTYFCESCQT